MNLGAPGEVPFLDIHSRGRALSQGTTRLSLAQIEQIGRTVRRTPEVMVKVTGGAKTIRAAAAHLSYISQEGKLELDTDEGERVTQEGQKELLKDWHLELSAGQYRNSAGRKGPWRGVKLIHNIVLSMPAPTAPDKVLAAARTFAREKFALKHRYVMALHLCRAGVYVERPPQTRPDKRLSRAVTPHNCHSRRSHRVNSVPCHRTRPASGGPRKPGKTWESAWRFRSRSARA
jgi:hypothetical protein